VLSPLLAEDEEKPAKIRESVLAVCLPNEQAELGDILDEMMVFAQEAEMEMEYLMRCDTLKIRCISSYVKGSLMDRMLMWFSRRDGGAMS